jgi:peptide/nickel transport system permease protein
VVINYGGYIDDINRADIGEALNTVSLSMPGASIEEIAQATENLRWTMEEAYGLHEPFLLRCVRWWYQAMTLDWGETFQLRVGGFTTGQLTDVRLIVLERVPYTLLLAGATNFLLFFASMFAALKLSKNNGSMLDRLAVSMSPLSAIPNWVYGIILTVIFAGVLHLLPFNGMFDTFPPATKWGYVPIVLKHMILPVSAIFLGMFFSTVYTWRTFFLIHSGEDYLEMAKAKGLPNKIIDRRYVLKPTLPYIITSFMILMITFWQGIIVLEVFFDWPGLGQLFMTSITKKEMWVTIGIVFVFALLLGFSVFLLDIIYALVDPRVKIEGSGQTLQPVERKRDRFQLLFSKTVIQLLRATWQKLVSASQRHITLPGQRYLATSTYASTTGYGYKPAASLRGYGSEVVSVVYCPHLKLENSRGQTLQAAPNRCRCTVHGHPERIGNAFQAQVCRSSSYSQCQRMAIISDKRHKVLTGSTNAIQAEVGRKKRGWQNPILRELFHYPLAVAGVGIIILLIFISIVTLIAIPYKDAVARWAPLTVEKYLVPKNALPAWVNLFRKDPLPPTIIQDSAAGDAPKVFTPEPNGIMNETITYTIDYPYGGFPKDLMIVFDGQYEKKPFVILTWITPDRREFKLGNFSAVSTQRYLASEDIPKKYLTDEAVQKEGSLFSGSGGISAVNVLFTNPAEEGLTAPLKGTYELRIQTTLFDENANMDAKLILYGQVYGLAGTDDLRRDLMVPLLWGIPVALAFGFLGAITTGVLAMMIAAGGVWYGGWIDNVIQRLTEMNMILPTLPIAITLYYLYSKSIWMILGVIIILSIFGSAIKTYRSAFLQVKESSYIEAAQAYGASNWRIIRYYLVPRIIPLLIPQLVILVPTYVFFEATLAYLNVSDPYLPTWGKVIYDALTRGVYHGYYYWVLEPVAMMILTGLAFAVVGFALDSILNPRLRKI